MKYNDSCIERLMLLNMVNYPTKSSFSFHIHGAHKILLRLYSEVAILVG